MTQRAMWVLGGALIVCGAVPALAGGVNLGRVGAQAGQTVTVPIHYEVGRGGPVATALSTDIRFDKELANPRCAVGRAISASGADKSVQCAEASPGDLRILIFGFNQDPIPSGEVATVTFDVLASGRHRLHKLRNLATASDANGQEFPLTRKSGIVRVGAP